MTHDLWNDLITKYGRAVAEELARDYVAMMREYVAELTE
jgi:hypothetical protein